MSALKDLDTDQLLQFAASGDAQAADQLFRRYRQRIRKLVAIRLDAKLAARVDLSDVVQDVLIIAHQRLKEYLRDTCPRHPRHRVRGALTSNEHPRGDHVGARF
jgi:RNA polymerase sigma-70 factor (ECF subfamily)